MWIKRGEITDADQIAIDYNSNINSLKIIEIVVFGIK